MSKIKIEAIRKYTPKDVHAMLSDGIYTVQFADGTILDVSAEELVFSCYVWTFFKDVEFNIKPSYLISNYYSNDSYVSSSLGDLLSVMWYDLQHEHLLPANLTGEASNIEIFKRAQQISSDIYNIYSYDILSSLISIDLEDLMEIQDDEDLERAISMVRDNPSMASVTSCYDVLKNTLRSNKYKNNQIVKSYKAGMLNESQIMQALGSRGFTSEMTNRIFKFPVINSFFMGLNDLYSIVIESRSAAKALVKSTKSIADTEYLTRRVRLVSMSIENVIPGTCGTTSGMSWYVKPKDDSTMGANFKGGLASLVGSMYRVNDEWETIKSTDTHLLGTTIELRTILSCVLENKHDTCACCYGDKSAGAYSQTLLGKLATTVFLTIMNQLQLSAKHVLTSATMSKLILDPTTKGFVTVKGNFLRLDIPISRKTKYYLQITETELFGLKGLENTVGNLAQLDVSRISSIDRITIVKENHIGELTFIPMVVSYLNRKAQLTKEFIAHILTGKAKYHVDGYYRIDMEGFDGKRDLFASLPEVEYSASDLARVFGLHLGNVNKDIDILSDMPTAVSKLYTVLGEKVNVSITDLAVLVYAYSIANKEKGDYGLPRFGEDARFSSEDALLTHRSLGAGLGGPSILPKLLSPNSFRHENRPDSIFDVVLKPQEVVKARVSP